MSNPLGPAHLTDVNQSFHTLFKPHKGAVIHNVNHRTFGPAADRITLFDGFPRTGRFLFKPQ